VNREFLTFPQMPCRGESDAGVWVALADLKQAFPGALRGLSSADLSRLEAEIRGTLG